MTGVDALAAKRVEPLMLKHIVHSMNNALSFVMRMRQANRVITMPPKCVKIL